MRHELIEGRKQIHPEWCACNGCRRAADRRSLRSDLLVMALGVLAALAAAGWFQLFGSAH